MKRLGPFLLGRRILAAHLQAAILYWVVLPGLVVGGGLAVDHLLGLHPWPATPAVAATALLMAAVGVTLVLMAMDGLSRRGGGTPSPKAPARRLVTGGVYNLCRHPMWLGYDLTAVAVALALGSPGMFLVSLPLFGAWQLRFLRREEQGLLRRFGPEYRSYMEEVPLLIPRFPFRHTVRGER